MQGWREAEISEMSLRIGWICRQTRDGLRQREGLVQEEFLKQKTVKIRSAWTRQSHCSIASVSSCYRLYSLLEVFLLGYTRAGQAGHGALIEPKCPRTMPTGVAWLPSALSCLPSHFIQWLKFSHANTLCSCLSPGRSSFLCLACVHHPAEAYLTFLVSSFWNKDRWNFAKMEEQVVDQKRNSGWSYKIEREWAWQHHCCIFIAYPPTQNIK